MSYSTRWLLAGFLVMVGLLAIVAGFFTLPTDVRFGIAAILVGAGLLTPAAWWLRHTRRGKRVPRIKSASSVGALAVATGLVFFPWSNLFLFDGSDAESGLQQTAEGAGGFAPAESREPRPSTSVGATPEETPALDQTALRETPSPLSRGPAPIESEASIGPEIDAAPSPTYSPIPAPAQSLPQLPVQPSAQRLPQPAAPVSPQPVVPSLSQTSPQTSLEITPTESTAADQATSTSTEPERPSDVDGERVEDAEHGGGPGGEAVLPFDPSRLAPWLP